MVKNKGITNCNGCGACVIACKRSCIKLVDHQGVCNLDGCIKCNSCKLYCPLFMPVELPKFETFFEDTGVLDRDMPTVYREVMRKAKAGEHVEFTGTLCQIAALKSLLGDKLPHNLIVYPVFCDKTNMEACKECKFW